MKFKNNKARKNNFTFEICFEKFKNKFYILLKDQITEIYYNTLWRNLTFETVEEAKEFCLKVSEYYKKHRITQVSNCDSRLDEFLSTL